MDLWEFSTLAKPAPRQKVRSQDERDADRATAVSILTQAVVLAFAITGLIYFLPA